MATLSRKLLCGATALAVLAGDAGMALAQQACTQMQVLLSIAPKHRENVMEYIAPRIRERHRVELVAEAIGSANMVERVTAQAANPRITIAQWDVPVGLAACDQGLCAPINLDRAPSTRGLYDWAYSRDGGGNAMVLATNVIGVGIIYNEEELRKRNIAPPTSWADLRRPDLRGRLGITAPQSTWGTAALVMLAKVGGGGEGNINPGFDATKTLLPSVHTVFTWTSELSNLLQLGEMWVAVTGSNMAPALRQQGIPMRYVLPSEGAPVVNGGLSLVKNGPCEEAAYTYMDLYYSDEFQRMRMRDGGTASPSRTAWAGLTAEQRAGMGLTADDFGKLVGLDWSAINRDRPDWILRWQREIR